MAQLRRQCGQIHDVKLFCQTFIYERILGHNAKMQVENINDSVQSGTMICIEKVSSMKNSLFLEIVKKISSFPESE